MLALIRRYPTLSYFVLTFALSGGAVLAVIGGGSIPATPEEVQQLFLFVYLGLLLGPVGAGLIMAGIVGGSHGLQGLGRWLCKWRVEGRWFVVALCTAPVVLA